MTDRLKTVYPPKTSFCGGYKPGCTGTGDGQRLGISDSEKKGNCTIYVAKTKVLTSNHTTNLCLSFFAIRITC